MHSAVKGYCRLGSIPVHVRVKTPLFRSRRMRTLAVPFPSTSLIYQLAWIQDTALAMKERTGYASQSRNKANQPATGAIRPEVADTAAGFWEVIKSVAFALGILLFFIGWVYLSYYFKYFGLSIFEIDTDVFTYYLYGFYVAKEKMMAAVLLLYLAAMLAIYYKRERIRHVYPFVAVLIVTLFPITFLMARNYAREKVLSILTWKESTPPITFSFQKDFLAHHFARDSTTTGNPYYRLDSLNTARMIALSSQMELRKFYETADTYFVFYNKNRNDTLSIDVKVYQISKKDVAFSYSSNNLSSLQHFDHEKE
jgi:hypothetical protein